MTGASHPDTSYDDIGFYGDLGVIPTIEKDAEGFRSFVTPEGNAMYDQSGPAAMTFNSDMAANTANQLSGRMMATGSLLSPQNPNKTMSVTSTNANFGFLGPTMNPYSGGQFSTMPTAPEVPGVPWGALVTDRSSSGLVHSYNTESSQSRQVSNSASASVWTEDQAWENSFDFGNTSFDNTNFDNTSFDPSSSSPQRTSAANEHSPIPVGLMNAGGGMQETQPATPSTVQDKVKPVTTGNHRAASPQQSGEKGAAYIKKMFRPHILPLAMDETYTFVCYPQPTQREYLVSFPYAGEPKEMPAIGQEREYLISKGPQMLAKFDDYVDRQEKARLRNEEKCQELCHRSAKRKRALLRAQPAGTQGVGPQDMASAASPASKPAHQAKNRRRRKDQRRR